MRDWICGSTALKDIYLTYAQMNEEAELFDDFNATSGWRSTVTTTTREMLERLSELLSEAPLDKYHTRNVIETLRKYYDFTEAQHTAMDMDKDINTMINYPRPEFAEKARRLILNLISSNALDITREIGLLRQIKDIQDELNIISMVFENQRVVLEKMERISRSMQPPTLESASQVFEVSNDLASTDLNEQIHETKSLRKDSDSDLYDAPEHTEARLNPNMKKAEDGTHKGHVQRPSAQSNINIHSDRGMINIVNNNINDMSATQSVDRDIYNGDIWGGRHSPSNSSFPLRVVLQCAEDVEMMIQRTERTYKAVWNPESPYTV